MFLKKYNKSIILYKQKFNKYKKNKIIKYLLKL